MNNSGNSTHKPRAVDPARFRALATGIGQSQSMSASTGAMRAGRVADAMPARQRAALTPTSGYPAPLFPQPALDGGQFVDSEMSENHGSGDESTGC